jgi:hypothetical protein
MDCLVQGGCGVLRGAKLRQVTAAGRGRGRLGLAGHGRASVIIVWTEGPVNGISHPFMICWRSVQPQ